ncbi:hypothetical protein [Gillisia sp. JM1]|uniref:hypothetical protein n=1 Tax=Gillisia sp. JM1 TaxID=1283286 RepID=UPI00040B4C05|nr:hypothetical protein [Gillisia sp. JM1]
MSGDSFSIDQLKANSHFIFNKIFFFKNEIEQKASSLNVEKKTNSYNWKIEGIETLNSFWNRLVSDPESFNQNLGENISTILEKEKMLSASLKVQSVLSRELLLANNSELLLNAIEKCNKIFHEDFPGDFILEYNGNRLGMFLLEICYDFQNKANIDYKFNPEIKSFKGLF